MSDPYADVTWYDAREFGRPSLGWLNEEREQPFDRFPASMQEQISEDLWGLSNKPAGVYVDFCGAPDRLFAKWNLTSPMPQGDKINRTPQSGLDLYGRDTCDNWHWAGSRSPWNPPFCDGSLPYGDLDGQERDYRVYLPISTRVDQLWIGSRTPLRPVLNPDLRKPIAYYGTSIVHGAGVSRPGMPHACQMGRMLDRHLLNLGFAGRAWCEPAVATALGRLDPVLYLVDCLPNNTPEQLRDRLPEFLRILRAAKPETPVLLVEDRRFGGSRFQPFRQTEYREKNRMLHRIVQELQGEGLSGLTLATHPDWFGEDGEGTIDGSHPTDLGAWRMAQALEPKVRALLERI